MSILDAAQTVTTPGPTTLTAPYRRGDRITAISPEGTRFLVRVDAVTPTATGGFTVLGVVTAPRKFRSHVLSTVVDADGYGPAVRPVA